MFQTSLQRGLKMSLSPLELEAAFKRTKLIEQGYNFQSAMNCEALKICIVRLAAISQRKFNNTNQLPTYWWQKY